MGAILVTDDETLGIAWSLLLSRIGHPVRVFASAHLQQAMQETVPSEFALIDIDLHYRDPLLFSAWVRCLRHQVGGPIALLTDAITTVTVALSHRVGASDLIEKGFSPAVRMRLKGLLSRLDPVR